MLRHSLRWTLFKNLNNVNLMATSSFLLRLLSQFGAKSNCSDNVGTLLHFEVGMLTQPLLVFALRHSRPVPVLLHRGRCGMTAAFDAGMIGGRDQIHAAHGRTHAEHGKSIIGN